MTDEQFLKNYFENFIPDKIIEIIYGSNGSPKYLKRLSQKVEEERYNYIEQRLKRAQWGPAIKQGENFTNLVKYTDTIRNLNGLYDLYIGNKENRAKMDKYLEDNATLLPETRLRRLSSSFKKLFSKTPKEPPKETQKDNEKSSSATDITGVKGGRGSKKKNKKKSKKSSKKKSKKSSKKKLIKKH